MYGRSLALRDLAGSRVLLSFYRSAVCPLCNLRLLYLTDRYDDYRRRGLRVVAFFESSTEYVRRYLEQRRPPFPIIPDLERRYYGLYGLESSLWGAIKARLFRGGDYRMAARRGVGASMWENIREFDGYLGRRPADFLIAPDQRIAGTYYGRDAGDFMPFAQIERFLQGAHDAPSRF